MHKHRLCLTKRIRVDVEWVREMEKKRAALQEAKKQSSSGHESHKQKKTK